MIASIKTPVVGFAAFSGTGKTTLLRELIPLLRQRGLRLGLIKHSHHAFEVDRPGKDSYVLRKAGAAQLVVASARRSAVMHQHATNLALEDFLPQFDDGELDLILVEGYKHYPIPKIELHRPKLGHPVLARDDPNVVAIASDAPLFKPLALPLLYLNDPAEIVDFIMVRFLSRAQPSAA